MLRARQAYATIRFMNNTLPDLPADFKRYVFVYGTLRKGEERDINRLLPVPLFIGTSQTAGTLYHLGSYPGVRLGGHNWVQGEIYQIDAELERRLDEIEGILPQPTGEYIRREIVVQSAGSDVTCLVYELAAARASGKDVISSGDWVKRNDA